MVLRCVMLTEAYLECEAHVDAEVFVNKASQMINSVSDIPLVLRFKATFAKVLDSNRKFVEAAVRYHELSTTTNANVRQQQYSYFH
jgi:COP9 signalosome complex subunit 4